MQKMELKKRLLALGLTMALALTCLTACGGSASSSASSSAAASGSTSTAQEEGQYTGEPEPLTLPLSEEPKTITVYRASGDRWTYKRYSCSSVSFAFFSSLVLTASRSSLSKPLSEEKPSEVLSEEDGE